MRKPVRIIGWIALILLTTTSVGGVLLYVGLQGMARSGSGGIGSVSFGITEGIFEAAVGVVFVLLLLFIVSDLKRRRSASRQ